MVTDKKEKKAVTSLDKILLNANKKILIKAFLQETMALFILDI